MKNVLHFIGMLLIFGCSKSQDFDYPDVILIPIQNNEFEEGPFGINQLPAHWELCSNGQETHKPDVLTSDETFIPRIEYIRRRNTLETDHSLILTAGMNGEKECILQELQDEIIPGFNYSFGFWSTKAIYIIQNSFTGQYVEYDGALKIQLSGITAGGIEIILGESEVIDSDRWDRKVIYFTVDENIKTIKINTQYVGDQEYYGNVVLDQIGISGTEIQ